MGKPTRDDVIDAIEAAIGKCNFAPLVAILMPLVEATDYAEPPRGADRTVETWGCEGRAKLAIARGGLPQDSTVFDETALPGYCPQLTDAQDKLTAAEERFARIEREFHRDLAAAKSERDAARQLHSESLDAFVACEREKVAALKRGVELLAERDEAKAALNNCAAKHGEEKGHGDRMLQLLRAVDEAWGGHGEDNRAIYVVGPGAEPFLKALSEVEEYLTEP